MPKRVLIVDDEPGIRRALAMLLEDSGYEAVSAPGGAAALELLAQQEVALVLCDLAMPGMDGVELLTRLHRERPDLPFIMISAHGELEGAVRAVRAGAYDYLLKPIDEKRLFHTMERALEYQRVSRDYGVMRDEALEELALIGESEPMRRLRLEIERAAPSDGRILILGENGTGKELVARLIHEKSLRRDRPFIKVNSAAIPKDLIESELFGHETGAFTGATKARKGKLELADGGTLMLDEIGDMALDAQAKLLRVLSTGELERVGGSRPIPFDVRLLSASNRDLLEQIRAGHFREDLYHRINVIPLYVPSLRERGRDVEILAEHFLDQFSAGYRRDPPELEPGARALLRRHSWPGNVRELRNLMERVSIMHPSPTVSEADLAQMLGRRPGPETGPPPGQGALSGVGRGRPAELAEPPGPQSPAAPPVAAGDGLAEQWKSRVRMEEKALLEKTLLEAGWNVTLAAERLDIDRASLHRKMRRLGIERPGR